jgi:hypothetical protein
MRCLVGRNAWQSELGDERSSQRRFSVRARLHGPTGRGQVVVAHGLLVHRSLGCEAGKRATDMGAKRYSGHS